MAISCKTSSFGEIKDALDADIVSAKGEIGRIDKIKKEREAAIGVAKMKIINKYKRLEREVDFKAEESCREHCKKVN